ncbi:hypothetical protein M513_12703 [Trichuris suis]|uniref:Uncharacterized protein n=1 Tax=Trichuris suis TaxID=68888 RepID=A0A085LN92_9BILA|nr:hypothetical protein M513_12703 [Trichuris suis]
MEVGFVGLLWFGPSLFTRSYSEVKGTKKRTLQRKSSVTASRNCQRLENGRRLVAMQFGREGMVNEMYGAWFWVMQMREVEETT